eukprot:TRINITY_DN16193_c1_g1_i1.p1 TRINITY_DN16193_c1_g1~~TRINITY_DN16193_c1_g1_i1.p1  ORF type:complete len:100 (+),score=7.08 TRINITY_DN16193_c1_g1_i1:628-927(+)
MAPPRNFCFPIGPSIVYFLVLPLLFRNLTPLILTVFRYNNLPPESIFLFLKSPAPLSQQSPIVLWRHPKPKPLALHGFNASVYFSCPSVPPTKNYADAI